MAPNPPIRLAVLLSGSGTTLQNFLDLGADSSFPARVVVVLSSKTSAYGLERARKAEIPTGVVERKDFASVEEFTAPFFDQCRNLGVDLVCLAGFIHLLQIPEDFTNRVMNVHPALIPAFCGKGYYGMRVHQAVCQYGVKITGCTVHLADNQYDHGPIILQRAIPVLDEDTPESLAERVQQEERIAYPEAVRLFAEGKLQIEGRRVRILS